MTRRLWHRSLSPGLFSSMKSKRRKRGELETEEAPGPSHAPCSVPCAQQNPHQLKSLPNAFVCPCASPPLSHTTGPAPTGTQVPRKLSGVSCRPRRTCPATHLLMLSGHALSACSPVYSPIRLRALSHTQMGVSKPATFSSRFNSDAKLGRRAVSHSIFSLGEKK